MLSFSFLILISRYQEDPAAWGAVYSKAFFHDASKNASSMTSNSRLSVLRLLGGKSKSYLETCCGECNTAMTTWVVGSVAAAMDDQEKFMNKIKTLENVNATYEKVTAKTRTEDPESIFKQLYVAACGRIYECAFLELAKDKVAGNAWDLVCRFKTEHQFISPDSQAKASDLAWGVFWRKCKVSADIENEACKHFDFDFHFDFLFFGFPLTSIIITIIIHFLISIF